MQNEKLFKQRNKSEILRVHKLEAVLQQPLWWLSGSPTDHTNLVYMMFRWVIKFMGPIIYFFDDRSPIGHKQIFFNKHFLEGS